METIKLRWQLAKFAYKRLRREYPNFNYDEQDLPKYCRNLPLKEMSFLDRRLIRSQQQQQHYHHQQQLANRWSSQANTSFGQLWN